MAHSDSEAESLASQHSQDSDISFSQQFEPQEDDEELLWEVEKITAEKGKQYKVKWKGIDPKTLKPWAQSWVSKRDCTPDLVIAWKAQKKETERRKSTASKRGRDSTASKKSVVLPKASASNLPETSRSTSSKLGRGRSSTASTRAATTVSPSTIRKRSKSAVDPIPEISSDREAEEDTRKTNAKGKKRKLAEADSAHNSANVPIDVNVNKTGDAVEKRTVDRPSKKRKIEVEIIKQEPGLEDVVEGWQRTSRSQTHTQGQPQATQDEESYEVRKLRGKSALPYEEEEEDEEEERMVEDALSQGYNSPTPVLEEEDQLEEDYEPKPTIDKGKGRAMEIENESEVDELAEDYILVISRPSKNPPKKKTTNGKSTVKASTKPGKSSKPSTTSKTKAKPTKKSNVEVVPESIPPSPPPKFGPPSRKSSSNPKSKPSKPSKTPQPVTPSTAAPAAAPKDPTNSHVRLNPNRRVIQISTNHPRRSSVPFTKHDTDTDSDSASDSDSDSNPPPLVWTGSQSNNSVPIEEPSAVWQGDSEVLVSLTPEDLERLRVFDKEVMYVPVPGPSTSAGARLAKPDLEKTATSSKSVGKEKEAKGQLKKEPSGRNHSQEIEAIDLVSSEGSPPPSPKPAEKQQASSNGDVRAEEERNRDAAKVVVESDVEARPTTTTRAVSKEPQQQQQPKRDIKSTTPKPKSTSSSTELTTNGNRQPRSVKPSNNDHNEVIPETEEEGSQSQSQSLNLDLPTPAPPSYLSYSHPPSTPGGRSTVRSRMKPRTPLSRASSTASHSHNLGERPLGPIPELLPSVFHPHLPEPISSLPESITDTSASDNRKDDDEDAVMSSIEDFDTPDKAQKPKSGKHAARTVKDKDLISGKERQKQEKESAEEIWESDVVKRGQEIAEAAKRKSEAERNEPAQRPKRTVDDIRATRSRSGSNVSVSLVQHEKGKGKGKGKEKEKEFDLIHEKIVEEDEEMQGVSTAVVPPASGPRAVTQDDESLTLQEMEEAYVDLNGGALDDHDHREVPDAQDLIALRQEEEESTQDIMMDIVQRRIDDVEIGGGWSAGPAPLSEPAVVPPIPLDAIPEVENDTGATTNENGKAREIPEIVIQEVPSQSETSRPETSEEDPNVWHMRTTRSRSRSQTSFVVNQTKNGNDKEKAKASSKKTSKAGSSRQTSLAPNDGPGQSHIDLLDRLNAAVALTETQSSDLIRLESELASEKIKTAELQAKADNDHQAMAEAIHLIHAEFATEKEALEHMVKDAETKHGELLAEKTEWEAERARLVAELESARQGKLSAEKDRDFFREQYGQASGYVTSVRDENRELEKRIQIAEGQAQAGVALVKNTFEQRVKALEADAKSWRKMAEFMIEKDRRSDNDELRRRAGEQPELVARCAQQSDDLEALEERIEELETQVEQKIKDWLASRAEVQKWKNELTQVHIALTEATTKLDRLGRAGGGGDGHSADPTGNANEFVYCCQWRISDGGESRACREVFPTMSGFEEHIVNMHLGA